MTAVFLGTPESAVPTLEALAEAGHSVPLVVSQPDRASGRHRTPRPTPVKQAAGRLGIPVVQPTRVKNNTDLLDRIRSARPDVLVVVAYGRILPRSLLDLPPLGAVNVHFSLLPRYRGAAPVQWALARGETVTGVTTMLISERLDEGDILLQESVAIAPGEHAPALTSRLARVGASLLVKTLEGIASDSLRPRPQSHDEASLAPRLRREDGLADFSLTAAEVEGRVRGFDPWPGVWAVTEGGRRLRIVAAESRGAAGGAEPPGRVIRLEDDAVLVACGGGTTLTVRSVQPEGRRAMTAREAVNGRHLSPGSLLERPVLAS